MSSSNVNAIQSSLAEAQALDDAADDILLNNREFDDPEDLFHWLTNRAARIRRQAHQ